MYSRAAGQAYTWTEGQGLAPKSREHFWSHVAEYPCHHPDLPPGTEAEFVEALRHARETITNGAVFPFNELQISQIIARYQDLTDRRSQGSNVTPDLAWLMGMIMPLDAVNRRVDDYNLAALLNGSHS
ncbi:hypothetical protein CVT26_005336 [Gymnopilus dilepis]|uniref:Uncharacterized protein n=1 Tax=Gymnopilus dilepis TaxID=231916 RepID=A0A409YT10_9AGAR|nr:hypothetical protein CVT26_005336 [Gymnopilus dilepis]